jgi:hypothetical protein
MTDIVSGRYPAYDPIWLITGKRNNETQADVPVRTNLSLFKYSTVEDGALAATKVGCLAAVPVQEGDVISSVTYLIGATPGQTVSAGFVALYTGKAAGALLAQSKSENYNEALKASEAYKFTLEKSVLITSENAPKGFIYVVLALVSAVAIPTAVCSGVPKACQQEWFTGGPEVLGGTVGTGLGTTAEATLGTVTSKANAPLVFLR